MSASEAMCTHLKFRT